MPAAAIRRAWRALRDLGARYLTLTHTGHNALADSSNPRPDLGDTDEEHGGLSPLGRQAVAELNRLGMLVDIAHVSKASMLQAAALSRTPVLSTHSCIRALCDNPRNLDDDQLDALRDTGGVVQITAVPHFLRTGGKESTVTLADYADHIDAAVARIGIAHVGISSDFDGGGGFPAGTMPATAPASPPNCCAAAMTRGRSACCGAAISSACSAWRNSAPGDPRALSAAAACPIVRPSEIARRTRMPRNTITLIWAAGIVLALFVYVAGPDRFVVATFDLVQRAWWGLQDALRNISVAAFDLVRALSIGLYFVFAALSVLAIRQSGRGRGTLIGVSLLFFLLVWQSGGDAGGRGRRHPGRAGNCHGRCTWCW